MTSSFHEATAPVAPVSVAVLVDVVLLRSITRFLNGYPQLVTQFYRDVTRAGHVAITKESTIDTHSNKRRASIATKFVHRNGLLVQLAIIENNQRVLEMLYRLALDEQDDRVRYVDGSSRRTVAVATKQTARGGRYATPCAAPRATAASRCSSGCTIS